MLAKINARLSQNKRYAWILSLALLIFTAWGDHVTKMEYGFGLFYLMPIALMTWYCGIWPGLSVSAAAGLTWFTMDYLDYLDLGESFAKLSLITWNAAMALVIFVIMTAVLAKLKTTLEHETEVAKLKTDILSIVSHEINNSLTSMGLALLLLQQEKEESARLNIYRVLERTYQNLKLTVNNFLNQARMESGRFFLDIRQMELRKLAEESIALMRPLSEQKQVAISTDFPTHIFPVNADPDAMALIMSNLIGNAIKYTPAGGRVVVRLKPLGAPVSEVEISVEDTGIGIAPEDQEAVFKGFFRTEASKKEAKGFGVGLKVSKDILESHESALKLESAPGKGSRFFFTLPICPEDCPNRLNGLCHRCRRRNPQADAAAFKPAPPPVG
ncbi:MAG: HAMP domain-containing sensor histidine kinase [Elusimicrobiota bacterium]|jgi:signal transduction histidine kinase